MDILEFVQQVAPNAQENRATIVVNSELTAKELFDKLIEKGATPQAPNWVPVDRETAISDFGMRECEGTYFMEITLPEDGRYEFCINPDGKTIDSVWMGE